MSEHDTNRRIDDLEHSQRELWQRYFEVEYQTRKKGSSILLLFIVTCVIIAWLVVTR